MQKKIAVIGAGLSGLVAARNLHQAGNQVTVFEKARGPGGRMSTRRQEDYAFDHGAQYFTCRDERFRTQVEDWLARGVVAEWKAPVQALNPAGASTPTKEKTTRYVGTPRMSSIGRDLAQETELITTQRITSIGIQDDRAGTWVLESETGEVYPDFETVVLSTPAPQAVPLLSCDPEFQKTAESVSMLPCHATLVTFSKQLDPGFGGAFVENSPLSWVARNSTKTGRPEAESWVLHSHAEWSLAHMDASPEDVSRKMLQALSEVIDSPLPEVLFSTSHRWLLARSEEPLDAGYLWKESTGLGVCGDWLHGDRVEGAFLSGLELATAIKKSMH